MDVTRRNRTRGLLHALLLVVVLMAGTAACSTTDSSPARAGVAGGPAVEASAAEGTGGTASPGPESDAPTGSADALEAYVEARRAEEMRAAEQFSQLFSEITMEAAPDSRTLVYTYTYREQVDVEQAGALADGVSDMLRSAAQEAILPEMEANGVVDPRVRWTYFNPDGEVVATYEFSQ